MPEFVRCSQTCSSAAPPWHLGILNVGASGLPCMADELTCHCDAVPGSWWATATASAAPCGAGTWRSRGTRPAASPQALRAQPAATTPRPRCPAPGRRRRSGTLPAQSSLRRVGGSSVKANLRPYRARIESVQLAALRRVVMLVPSADRSRCCSCCRCPGGCSSAAGRSQLRCTPARAAVPCRDRAASACTASPLAALPTAMTPKSARDAAYLDAIVVRPA